MEKLNAGAVSSMPSTERSGSRKTLILQRQRILFSAFRSDQYSDPEGYMASLGMVLDQYPTDVIVYITDPRTGVQRACKWPPTIAEIIEACDKRMHEKARRAEFENWGQRNETPQLEAPRHERPTLAELKAKYGEHWGIEQPTKRKPEPCPSWQSIITGYQADPERIARLTRRDVDHENPDL